MTRYLMLGSGAAGISAAEAIRKIDLTGDIMLVSEERDGYYSRPGLAYLLTGEVPEEALYPFRMEDFQRLRLRMVHGRVGQIFPEQHQVLLQGGQQLGYDRLLIATGARAVKVKLPGVELQGVVTLESLAETRIILKLARKAHQAVVVGGGITALELVEGLRYRGVQVDYLLRGERYWSNVLDETESRIVEQRLKEEGVRIHYHSELAEILGKDGRVVGVHTNDGRHVKCDMVGLAIGVAPRKELGEAAGLKVDKGILVDETMRTSIADIYAAGDVAQVYDPGIGRAIVDSLWEPARAQGRTAGMNMAGQAVQYYKGSPFNVTRLAGITTTIIGSVGIRDGDPDVIGIVRGDSEAWRQPSDGLAVESHCEVNRLRLLLGETQVIGGVVMGDQVMSRVVQQLVIKQIDIGTIQQRLLQPDISIEAVLSDFMDQQRNVEGRQNAAQQS
jgi:NAD(P)H-nitrite reductase large subunit